MRRLRALRTHGGGPTSRIELMAGNVGPDAIELPRAQATQHPDAPVALWSGCARPGREPPYSEQGQATRR